MADNTQGRPPITEEVRKAFACDWQNGGHDEYLAAQFDRWLVAHDAEVAAAALREAADTVATMTAATNIRWGVIYGGDPEMDAVDDLRSDPEGWLRARADELGKPVADPLDENDHRDRLNRKGVRLVHVAECGRWHPVVRPEAAMAVCVFPEDHDSLFGWDLHRGPIAFADGTATSNTTPLPAMSHGHT